MIVNQLDNKFDDYLNLLKVLCECYDSKEEEILALPIATVIRVLVHDTNNSTSLLQHLDIKKRKYVSTNQVLKSEGVHLGLVRRVNIGVKDGFGGEAKYWPLCDERYFSMPSDSKLLEFDEWWNDEVVFSSQESQLTRKDLVLSVANKDGGAHFDSKVEKKYDDFRHSWSGGSTLVGLTSGTKRGYDNIPTYPGIRQIAFEMLSSLQESE